MSCFFTKKGKLNAEIYILRKSIEGYLDSVPSLTFNIIKT